MFAEVLRTVSRKLPVKHYFADPPPGHSLPFEMERLPTGQMASFGSRNPDRVFYVIWRAPIPAGFFANLSYVLCHLMVADSLGMEPVVDFENFPTLYNEEEEIQGTRNAWEYYFRQTSSVSLRELYESRHVFFCDGKWPVGFGFGVAGIPGARQAFDKYVKVLPDIADGVSVWMEELGTRALGIHFRGQEQRRASDHPLGPTKQQMLEVATRIIREGSFGRIFLVTEDQGYLDLFRNEFGNAVIATDSFRTRGENAYRIRPRPLHRYMLGREVLVDALLLSRCQALIASSSNVSEFAKLMNGDRYDVVWQIWNGWNSSNPIVARYLYDIRRRLPRRLGGLPGKVLQTVPGRDAVLPSIAYRAGKKAQSHAQPVNSSHNL